MYTEANDYWSEIVYSILLQDNLDNLEFAELFLYIEC